MTIVVYFVMFICTSHSIFILRFVGKKKHPVEIL